MILYLRKTAFLIFLLFPVFFSQAQTTDVYTTASSWVVPATVSTIAITVYGGGAGTGGQDCGAGCTNAAAGPVGYVVASYTVAPGDVVGIYPGGKGANGANSVTGTGGGAGGADTYPTLNFNGGNGGNAGSSGSSGGGGGGGAASVVTINSVIQIVAGGAGGGGGMANSAGSGLPGSATATSNGTNTGGNGTTPGGDGGGGGGGGGGQFASAGGGVHAAGSESAGNGGLRGGNSVTGASLITTNGTIAWTNAGRIEITFLSTLPVTWSGFSATQQNNNVLLKWSTSSEQNTKDYRVQRSVDGSNWSDIATVAAAGNSTTEQQYSFIDENPASGGTYYRLVQEDLDGNFRYSKIISTGAGEMHAKVTVYPNPVSNGLLTIRLSEASIVKVYNSIGMQVMQQSFSAGTHPLAVAALSRGVYYLQTKDDHVTFIVQ